MLLLYIGGALLVLSIRLGMVAYTVRHTTGGGGAPRRGLWNGMGLMGIIALAMAVGGGVSTGWVSPEMMQVWVPSSGAVAVLGVSLVVQAEAQRPKNGWLAVTIGALSTFVVGTVLALIYYLC